MSDDGIWIVRAEGGKYVEEFIEDGMVSIGWSELGHTDAEITKDDLKKLFAEKHPEASEGSRNISSGQIFRFFNEISVGDAVGTYDPHKRTYFLGEITSNVQWRDHKALPRYREATWQRKVGRDRLSTATRNALGAGLTLFHLSPEVREELWSRSVAVDAVEPTDVGGEEKPEDEAEEVVLRDEIVNKAHEFVEDRIARLGWDEMQELVAGLLRAMGYRTRIADAGPDRGVDIFASPDGLGLQEPRIFIEVKHRRGEAMGGPAIRAFLGGRRDGDRCLYVSTGGFTKDARYEADRSSIPITLVSLPQLRELVLDHYENFDAATTALLPLEKLYWPVD